MLVLADISWPAEKKQTTLKPIKQKPQTHRKEAAEMMHFEEA